MPQKTLLYLSGNRMPDGSAYAERAKSLAALFTKAGYKVHIISDYITLDDYLPGEVRYVNGIEYEGLSSKRAPAKRRELAGKCAAAMRAYLEKNRVDFAVFNAYSARYKKVTGVLKSYGVPYTLETCEHIDSTSYRFGRLNYRYWKIEKYFKKVFPRDKGMIAISRHLRDYFAKGGMQTLIIPVVFDNAGGFHDVYEPHNTLTLTYAGNCSKSKENISSILKVLREINRDEIKIVFNLYGPSNALLRRNLGKDYALLEGTEDYVKVFGSVKREKCLEAVSKSDYVYFLRPDRLSSHAGFPTKLTEAFSQGTPVITNDTGDICLYLKDGVNGLVVRDDSETAVRDTLQRALEIKEQEYLDMRKAARTTFEEKLNVDCFVEDFKQYAETVKKIFKEKAEATDE